MEKPVAEPRAMREAGAPGVRSHGAKAQKSSGIIKC
jgi:hypothetical protein